MARDIHPRSLLLAYGAAGVLALSLIDSPLDAVADVPRVLAAATGILALAWLLLQFVSSGRYRLLSRRASIDRTMRFHQLAAIVIVVLAVLHPLFLLTPLDTDALRELPARAQRMFTAPHLMSGVVAWTVLIVLIAMGIWRNRLPLRYEWWRSIHVAAAVVVAAGGLHHALAVGAYGSETMFVAYWGMLGALAFGTLGYLYLVKPFLLMRTAHRVVSNEEIGHGIREIILEPERGKRLAYEAGQFTLP